MRVLQYSLLIHPLLLPTLPLDESAVENLEVNRRASERGESQVPCPKEDIGETVGEGALAVMLARLGVC